MKYNNNKAATNQNAHPVPPPRKRDADPDGRRTRSSSAARREKGIRRLLEASEGVSFPPGGLTQWQRSTTLTKLARYLQRIGMKADSRRAIVDIVNEDLCEPPLSRGDLNSCLENASLYVSDFRDWASDGDEETVIRFAGTFTRMGAPRSVVVASCEALAGIDLGLPDFTGVAEHAADVAWGGGLYAVA